MKARPTVWTRAHQLQLEDDPKWKTSQLGRKLQLHVQKVGPQFKEAENWLMQQSGATSKLKRAGKLGGQKCAICCRTQSLPPKMYTLQLPMFSLECSMLSLERPLLNVQCSPQLLTLSPARHLNLLAPFTPLFAPLPVPLFVINLFSFPSFPLLSSPKHCLPIGQTKRVLSVPDLGGKLGDSSAWLQKIALSETQTIRFPLLLTPTRPARFRRGTLSAAIKSVPLYLPLSLAAAALPLLSSPICLIISRSAHRIRTRDTPSSTSWGRGRGKQPPVERRGSGWAAAGRYVRHYKRPSGRASIGEEFRAEVGPRGAGCSVRPQAGEWAWPSGARKNGGRARGAKLRASCGQRIGEGEADWPRGWARRE